MSDQPAPTSQPTIVPGSSTGTELFQLAATLAGCQPIDLVDVSINGPELVVGLATGQQFVFNPATLGAQVLDTLRAQLEQVLANAGAAPAPAAPKKRAR